MTDQSHAGGQSAPDTAAEHAARCVAICVRHYEKSGGPPVDLGAALMWYGLAVMRGAMPPEEVAKALYVLADAEAAGGETIEGWERPLPRERH